MSFEGALVSRETMSIHYVFRQWLIWVSTLMIIFLSCAVSASHSYEFWPPTDRVIVQFLLKRTCVISLWWILRFLSFVTEV
jgi:hypothetical protein